MSGTPPALHTRGAAHLSLVLAKHISMSNLVDSSLLVRFRTGELKLVLLHSSKDHLYLLEEK